MRHPLRTGLALLAVSSCVRPPAPDPATLPVAIVDGQPIPAYALKRALLSYQHAQQDAAARSAVASAILDELIVERALLQQADREGIQVSREEVTEVLERSAQGYRVRDYQELLHGVFLTPALLRDQVEARLRSERLVQAHVRPPAPADDAAVQAYYAANRAEFEVPEQVRARQIVVRTREEAEQLRERARKTPFDELARRSSVAPEAGRGGDLGLFGRGVMPPVFDEVCFALKPGEISDVVTSEYGFHLFQVVEARPAETIPLEQARARIEQELAARDRQAQATRFVDELRTRARVERFPEVLQAVIESLGPDAAAEEPGP